MQRCQRFHKVSGFPLSAEAIDLLTQQLFDEEPYNEVYFNLKRNWYKNTFFQLVRYIESLPREQLMKYWVTRIALTNSLKKIKARVDFGRSEIIQRMATLLENVGKRYEQMWMKRFLVSLKNKLQNE